MADGARRVLISLGRRFWGRPALRVSIPPVATFLVVVGLLAAANATVLTAPYARTQVSFAPSKTTSGACRTTASVTHTHWTPSSGNVSTLATATVQSCAAPPTGIYTAYASASNTVQVAFPVTVTTGGHNISVSVSYNLTVTAVTKGVLLCPPPKPIPGQATGRSCYLQISATTSWWMALWDGTNRSALSGSHGSVQGPTNYTDVTNSTQCTSTRSCTSSSSVFYCSSSSYYYGHCVASGTTSSGSNVSWLNTLNNCRASYGRYCLSWENWTLNSSHKYWVLVSFNAYTWVDLYHYPKGGSLLASVDASTPGSSGWRVTSVSVK